MGKTRNPYPQDFRDKMVKLVRSGRTPTELAKNYEPNAQTICNWVAQADRDTGLRTDGLTSAGQKELRQLPKENRQLREEREVLV